MKDIAGQGESLDKSCLFLINVAKSDLKKIQIWTTVTISVNQIKFD